MNNVIPFRYQDQVVRFSSDGWLHATKIAERFGKRIDHWLDNAETLEYIRALDEILNPYAGPSTISNTRKSGYLKSRRGNAGGTWLHPRLAVFFARWCAAKFSVWCDMRLEEILHGDQSAMVRLNRACGVFDKNQAEASTSGRRLALWKQQKPQLLSVIEHERCQLQMILGLDRPVRTSGSGGSQ